ncbi:MAG: hypothetical protein WB562_16695 [Candidatus Sulfotelmatobacter sp.]
MALVIEPYREEHETAVREFNSRLLAAQADPDLVFFGRATPQWLRRIPESTLYNEYFVALSDGIVRGGYALKHQDFYFGDGSVRSVAYYHHPLSEGIVNKSYAVVGSLLLRDAIARAPLLYCLGMGGYDRPLPKMLIKLGWSHCAIPFYFRVVKPSRFLREMQALRTTGVRRLLMDLGALTGIGRAALLTHDAMKAIRSPRVEPFETQRVNRFSQWADELWHQAENQCAFAALRDSRVLNLLYPPDNKHFIKLQVSRNGKTIGWAVAGERRKDSKFGEMRVGSVIDCWAVPEGTVPVVRAATDALIKAGVDLIVSNQNHCLWQHAFATCGFLQAESNFIFAAGKGLSNQLQPFVENQLRIHMTRADGDGLPRNF